MAGIRSLGWYVPARRQSVSEVALHHGVSAAALEDFGLRSKVVAEEDDHPSTMAARAVRAALEAAELTAADVDLLIFTGATRDRPAPWVAAFAVLDEIGAPRAAGFDLSGRCPGLGDALWVGANLIRAGTFRTVVVCCGDRFDHLLPPSPDQPSLTNALYSAGGAAAVLTADAENQIVARVHSTRDDLSGHGAGAPLAGGTRWPTDARALDERAHIIQERSTVAQMVELRGYLRRAERETIQAVMAAAGWDSIDFITGSILNVKDQAEFYASLGIGPDSFLMMMPDHGHVGVSSVLMSVGNAIQEGMAVGPRLILNLRTHVYCNALAIRGSSHDLGIRVSGPARRRASESSGPIAQVPAAAPVIEVPPRESSAAAAPVASSREQIRPRDPLEQEVARVWQQVLGVGDAHLGDNFFAAGGTSVTAVQLVSALRRALGRTVPFGTLFHDPTLLGVCEALRRPRSQARHLIEIKPGTGDAPLFLAHPVNGSVFCYSELARRLGPQIPVYGLHARGLEDDGEPFVDLEEMAAVYVEELLRVQQEGPYLLGGWSMGGVIALEMALQLERSGREVSLLVQFDTYVPTRPIWRDDADTLLLVCGLDQHPPWLPGEELSADERMRRVLALVETTPIPDSHRSWTRVDPAAARVVSPGGLHMEEAARLLHVHRSHAAALMDYAATVHAGKKRFSGKVLFFMATQLQAGGGRSPGDMEEVRRLWAELSGELSVELVHGCHGFMFRDPPCLAAMSEALVARLDQERTP